MKLSYINLFGAVILLTCLGMITTLLISLNTKFNFVVLFFLLISFYSAVRLTIISFSGDHKKIMEMTFYVFTFIFMGLTPIAQISIGEFPLNGFYDDSDFMFAAFIIIVGIVGYDLGVFFGNKKKISLNNKKLINIVVTKKKIIIMTVISFLLFIISSLKFGGIDNLFIPRNELNSGFEKLNLLVYTCLLRIPVFITLVYSILWWKNRKQKSFLNKTNLPILSIIVFLLIINLIASNPISTPRFWFGMIILTILIVFKKWKKYTIFFATIGTLVVFLFVFPYADIFRYDTEIQVDIENLNTQLSTDGDYDAFQQLLNIKLFVEGNGYSFGNQLAGAVLFWVPRSLWESKAYGTGALVAEYSGYSYTNLSAPLWGEFYIDFGLIGVLFFFYIYGFFTAKLQNIFKYSKEYRILNSYQIIIPILAAYQIFLLRGELLSTVSYLIVNVFFALLSLILFNKDDSKH